MTQAVARSANASRTQTVRATVPAHAQAISADPLNWTQGPGKNFSFPAGSVIDTVTLTK